ncbi:MAG: DUF4313 domain-containing protein [Bacteroidales bacterium]|nr:DUF4313 domain-containing protein [Bacteroidales bacterium]
MKQYKYKGKLVSLRTDTYRNNGTLAVVMEHEDGETDVITTNLNSPLQSESLAFMDENNNPGIGKWLEKNGLGLPMGIQQQSGFCEYPLYTIFISAL